ncbi:MAG TPA: ubiquinol-cytochrome c reductase iron-sulfur subunit [Anaerolineales bacterium]|nr:ubiquinol-cytochrome c reductase iron-sulfur subunit [Anaerolineales bacterium]
MGNSKKQAITRGEFLNFAWAVSLVGLFGQASAALWRFILPRRQSGAFGDKIVAGRVQEFQLKSVSHVQKGRFYISRLEDGSLLALWHRCTHLGCTVPWREDEGVFHCPCHSSVFNLRGEVLSGPAPRPLDLFPIEFVAGEIVVDTSRPIERDTFDPSQATRA